MLYIAFFTVLILLRVFLFEIYTISQSSMKNTYQPGDRVLILKKKFTIKQNDVFVFRHQNENVIKRCVCLPGDTLKIQNGILYVNNIVFENPKEGVIDNYDNEDVIARSNIYFTYGTNWTLNDFGPYIIPKKGMKVLLTPESLLLYNQVIEKDSLYSDNTALEVKTSGNTYVFKKDYLFFVGDNRKESIDSRFFGPIPVTDIIGKVFLSFQF